MSKVKIYNIHNTLAGAGGYEVEKKFADFITRKQPKTWFTEEGVIRELIVRGYDEAADAIKAGNEPVEIPVETPIETVADEQIEDTDTQTEDTATNEAPAKRKTRRRKKS